MEGYSLEAQVNVCKAFITQRKWKLVSAILILVIPVKMISCSFMEMITDAETGMFKAILFHKLDRFSRNSEQTMRYFRYLKFMRCDDRLRNRRI